MATLFNKLCSLNCLYSAWTNVKAKNTAGGIDGLSVLDFDDNLSQNMKTLLTDLENHKWVPQPYLHIEIKKNETEKRKLGLLSIRDKIVQQAIRGLIEPRFEKLFLNNSYGYRPQRGHLRAIRRSLHELLQTENKWVAKLDVDNYFDTVNHEVLFSRLKHTVSDEKILSLIELSVKMGVVDKAKKWTDATKGLPQGAVLSPLLANFYLHPFDQFVTSKIDSYIRYADDFIFLGSEKEKIERLVAGATRFLTDKLKLELNPTTIAPVESGVSFLGVEIAKGRVSITLGKQKKLLERIAQIEMCNGQISSKSLKHLDGIKRYYAQILTTDLLEPLDKAIVNQINILITENVSKIRSKDSLRKTLRHITVTTRGISISADAILYCTENNISIDFFNNKGKHCASVSSPVPIGKVIWMNQVNMSDDKKIYLASRIIEGKIKNQLNLIRYYHKYHKNEYELKDRYTITSEQLTLLLDKIKKTEFFINSYQEKLIAIEAQAANTYWAYIRQLLDDDNIDFEKRVRQGASDLFNSMLNYGYAILYSRIWQALLAAKLNPSVGILHKPVHNKPTLAFDLIELFRSQVVDRIVISLIQTKQPLAIDNKGLLEEKTKQLLSKNVLERLNRYEKFRKQELRFDEIIKIQARDLAKYINEEKKSFLPYIAKW